MARKVISHYVKKVHKKRPNVHSKNASRSQTKFKKNIEDKGGKITNDNRKGIYEKPVLPFISHSL